MTGLYRFATLLAAAVVALPVAAEEAPLLNRALNERIVFINPALATELEVTIFKPDGPGPFPLAVINHGKSPGEARFQPRARFIAASRELVRRGYAVALPMRGGFSKSSGAYLDGGCNIEGNGRYQARFIRMALDWLVEQPWVDRERIIVMGQSHGGLAALAFATAPYPGVRGIVNFAGGLRLTSHLCFDWERSLVEAFGSYGGESRLPSLWFYGANDSYFEPGLARRLHDAYSKAGGSAKLVAYGAFKGDAHNTFGERDGFAVWWPETESFLKSLNLPSALLPRVTPADAGLAALADTTRIPDFKSNCAGAFELFLDADYPRAFAISADSRCGYAYGGGDPKRRALDFCQRSAREPCRLYAVDDSIVPGN